MQTILEPDRAMLTLTLLFIYAAFLPTAVFATLRLRERSRNALSILKDVQLLVRGALRDNAANISDLIDRGIEVQPGPVRFTPPLLEDDVNLSGQEIADDEQRRFEDFSMQDHSEQLADIRGRIEPIIDFARREGLISGGNIGVLIGSIALLIFGLLTGFTLLGLSLAVAGALLLIVDVITKLIGLGLPTASETAANELHTEVTTKKKTFNDLLRKKQSGR